MKKKKCPYCGRRVPYSVAFSRRRKAEYVCKNCGRESRVVVKRTVIPAFAVCVVISVAVFALWVYMKLIYNPLGILAIALPLIIFTLISPRFVYFEPLKKYKKTMEAKKAGIAYSDNLAVSELDKEFSGMDSGNRFSINTDIFNQIKADRTSTRESANRSDISSTSAGTEDSFVHVINNVSEQHAVDDAPLKKLHSEGSRINRHYIIPPEQEEAIPADTADDLKQQKPDVDIISENKRN